MNEIIDLLLRWIIGCESMAANSFLLVGIKQLHESGWCWGGAIRLTPMLMTVVQQAFIDWCIAYSKLQIVDDMSIVVVAHDVNSYDTLGKGVELGRYGYLEPRMVEIGRHHFPDAPGQPESAAFDEVYDDIICTALDEWLSGSIPIEQVSFPPHAEPPENPDAVYSDR
ncbi:hypothetical protein L0Z02_10015 [Burkholderia multivorans]|uniref:hypothetical protein n=2 Tax=Burkholderia cepacia complex TaxID=87882 RepID=UPI0015933BC9|nr:MULTISPECIES: hypothetical protein [Burkholderia cepacia complex]MCA8073832.1 hypothetical protein [Burkholderia vietnamiensis]MCO1457375.1 hypothetical protein [Burkholderia multivorans]MCO1466362.1 hypothetical protein [Burkholderia multivorans]UQO15947.1 hypothetical protein L0Z02_10015 [Burkholderia multivorans]UQO86688.1 hypothetical protein L0Y86_16460 [Burkholderia multivorans]